MENIDNIINDLNKVLEKYNVDNELGLQIFLNLILQIGNNLDYNYNQLIKILLDNKIKGIYNNLRVNKNKQEEGMQDE